MKLSRGLGPTRPAIVNVKSDGPVITNTITGPSTNGQPKVHTPIGPPKINSLQGRYIYDYNLIFANNIILEKLQYEAKSKIASYQQSLNNEIEKTKKIQTVLERRKSNEKIAQYKAEITNLESGYLLNRYFTLSKPIIEQYTKIGPRIKKINLEDGKEIQEESTSITAQRLSLITRFLEMAKEFIEVDVIREFPENNSCSCGASLQNNYVDEEGVQICESCSAQHHMIVNPGSSAIDDHNKSNSKEDYDDWENLYKAFIRFQGKQTPKDFTSVFNALDRYFANNKEFLRTTPCVYDSRGRRFGTTLPMMINALRDTHNAAYYEDARLICKLYWSWNLQDLSQFEQRLRNDYNETKLVFNQLLQEQHECVGNRTSALGTQYRLFKHLELLGVDCERDDFKTSIMSDVIETHDKIWEIICKRCNKTNPAIYFIPTIT